MQTLDQLRSGELAGTRHLRMSCGLTTFPHEIFQLADTLEVLDLSGNALADLPAEFARLGRLRIAFFSDNDFTILPEILGSCPNLTMIGFKANRIQEIPAGALPTHLRWLVLTDNAVEELPDAIGRCAQLQKLMLAGNRLRTLPPALAGCDRLELLRIAANRLDELPAWLLTMPRLTWLACSGNPFGEEAEADALSSAAIADVSWPDLELGQMLGEGASGVIHRATMTDGVGRLQNVAVKMFKGAVTSDGYPGSEMAASMRAGTHANLIGVLGKVVDHPTGLEGLVMRLVDPRMANVAGPPSLESCTRDIYASSTSFDVRSLLRLARGIASAACHLHGRGIMHGDLYGHNILHLQDGAALLGDFGAASFHGADGGDVATGLERLEVRGFGCLMEELIERCRTLDDESAQFQLLHDLKSACLSERIEARPLFAEIEARLRRIDSPGRTSEQADCAEDFPS